MDFWVNQMQPKSKCVQLLRFINSSFSTGHFPHGWRIQIFILSLLYIWNITETIQGQRHELQMETLPRQLFCQVLAGNQSRARWNSMRSDLWKATTPTQTRFNAQPFQTRVCSIISFQKVIHVHRMEDTAQWKPPPGLNYYLSLISEFYFLALDESTP